eukprot:289285-Rhodomonas_salina.2
MQSTALLVDTMSARETCPVRSNRSCAALSYLQRMGMHNAAAQPVLFRPFIPGPRRVRMGGKQLPRKLYCAYDNIGPIPKQMY